jgi:hypothetical protein
MDFSILNCQLIWDSIFKIVLIKIYLFHLIKFELNGVAKN